MNSQEETTDSRKTKVWEFLSNVKDYIFSNPGSPSSTVEEETTGWGNFAEILRKIQDRIISNPNPASSSSTLEHNQNVQVKEINENVYELYAPKEDDDIKLEIIFFHGLQQGACAQPHVTTWMTQSEPPVLWPKVWLGEELPEARILSVSYDSSGTRGNDHGRLDLYCLAENLFSTLIRNAKVGQRWRCPVVLVGHCIGGLLIKQLCLNLARKEFNDPSDKEYADTFLENVRGVFLLATPQQGIKFSISPMENVNPSSLRERLTIFDTEIARLKELFQYHCKRYKWVTKIVGESNKTITSSPMSLFHAVLVAEASARVYTDSFYTARASHFDICRPSSTRDSTFRILVDFVADCIQKEASTTQEPLALPNHVVGLDSRIKEVKNKIQEYDKLAIVGMGGIGKTTLAKAVFNDMSPAFEYTCFVQNLKDELKQPGQTVDGMIMQNLHKRGRKMQPQSRGVWSILKGKRLLLVLDDVDLKKHTDAIPQPGRLAKHSKVIATSRKKGKQIFPEEFFVYDTPVLNHTEAHDLFCKYASKSGEMSEKLVEKLVRKCAGLPLTLEVIGSYLNSEKSEGIWEAAFSQLCSAESIDGSAEDELWGKLRVSFDTLAPMEQAIFLDCACFASTANVSLMFMKAMWTTMWAATETGWRNLLDRCLVTEITNNDYYFLGSKAIGMHEQLRDMGRHLVNVPMTRIWKQEQALQLLMNDDQDQGLNAGLISGLQLANLSAEGEPTARREEVPCSGLVKMGKLKYFQLVHVNVLGNGPAFPPKLALLDLKNALRVVFSEDGQRQRWSLHESDIANLANLATLRLIDEHIDDITRLPENFGKLRNLKVLYLVSWNLNVLPDSFCQLSSLETLILGSFHLNCLPHSFGELTSLQHLVLIWCTSLKVLPDSFCQLSSLETLLLVSTSLECLPNSFGKLLSLQHLGLLVCASLRELPDSIGQLNSLQKLSICNCFLLETLPTSVVDLPNHTKIQLGNPPSDEVKDYEQHISQVRNLRGQLAKFGWFLDGRGDVELIMGTFPFCGQTFIRM